MTTEEFEELARLAGRVSEGIRLEFIEGRLGAKGVADGDHGRILQWLIRMFILARPELFLSVEQGLKVDAYRKGRARPDGTLADADAFVGQGEWADPDPVLMVVEVTSSDSDTEQRDRREKPIAYAATGIPIYLLIDREFGEITVFSQPSGARYQRRVTVSIGDSVELPAPVGLPLDTEPIKAWV
ncbi:Uma2 family endonuclease [Nocardia zapadnayensis]|uniref:Uma2 family endonuclease n=1 Tax=Nocardia rhamnosiphila TaxID=426716 RepID=UPI0022485525|nr:Uma2 family endonuclease [Nocardia zapadnayensis]MCX0270674.1 Uma2 family endonuclease [Nocardia zapadnayensis]